MKIDKQQLKQLIKEEITKLFEQPNPAPASHVPNVAPAGAGTVSVDTSDLDRLDLEIKKQQKKDEELVKKADEVGVDPMLVGDFIGVSGAFYQALMDFTYERYRMENQPLPPGAAEE